MTPLESRLDQAKGILLDVDRAKRRLEFRRRQIVQAIVLTFPSLPTKEPAFAPGERSVAGYTRNGIPDRNELRFKLDELDLQLAPIKAERVEAQREVDYVQGLIYAETEAEAERAAKKSKQQGDLFE